MDSIEPGITGRSSGDNSTSQLVSARKVLDRYDIVDRTLDRWVDSETLGFPQPVYIRKRRYFRLCELVEWERLQARSTAVSRVPA
jgi:hypothetical protein